MKKLSKALLLVFAIALMFTVFSVVTFASEDAAAATVAKEKANPLKFYNFDGYEPGSLAFEANDDGKGTYQVAIADNGNGYIEGWVAPKVEGSTANDSYLSGPYQANSTHNMAEWPILAIDIDIAKISGSYTDASKMYFYYYGYGDVYDELGNKTGTLKNATGANFAFSFSTIESFLPEEVMEWSHVTVLLQVNNIEGVNYISLYAYVNGECVYTNIQHHKIATTYSLSNYCFSTFRVNNSSGTVNEKNKAAYDNWGFTFFNAGYTVDEAAAECYYEGYELPYGITVAKIGEEVYDDINDAIDAAKSGEVIKLVGNISGTTAVEKTVIIDTNKYDDAGAPTGEFYEFTASSTTMLEERKDGIVTFSKAQNSSVQVFWDDCPGVFEGGDCTCDKKHLGDNGEHIMSIFSESVMLNSIPVYQGEIPEFVVDENGHSRRFVGWTYTQGGEAEEIRPISEADLEEGWVALYPVYEDFYYSYEYTDSDNVVTYYLAEEFSAMFSRATNGSTVKLLTDVEITSAVSLSVNITIDLNGYDLYGYDQKNDKYSATYDDATGTYVKGELIEEGVSTLGTTTNLFQLSGDDKTFTLKSSRSGSDVFVATIFYDSWICDGKEVKKEFIKADGGGLIAQNKAIGCDVVIYGDGITFYGSCLILSENHNNDNRNTLFIDGGTYYNAVKNYKSMVHWTIGGEVTIKNALFVDNNDGMFRVDSHAKAKANVLFENCDIIGNAPIRIADDDTVVTVKNCRIYGNWNSTYGAIFDDKTMTVTDMTSSKGSVKDGLSQISVSKTIAYKDIAAKMSLDIDLETMKPSGIVETTTVEVTYKYMILDPVSGVAKITWKDAAGNILATTEAIKGEQTSAPAVEIKTGNGYTAVTNVAYWTDEAGEKSDLLIGDESEYTFIAVLPAEEERNYVLYMDSAMLNMGYMMHFVYNLYLPVSEGVVIEKVGNTTYGSSKTPSTVWIYDQEYYVFTIYANTTGAFSNSSSWVTFSANGKSFTFQVSINAITYANMALDDPKTTDVEKEAIGCLIRYIEESYKYVDATVNADGEKIYTDAIKAKVEAFYERYTPAEYVTEYPANSIHTVNEKLLEGIVESVYFAAYSSGGKVTFIVELTDEAVAAGYTVAMSGITSNPKSRLDGKMWYTDNTKLHSSVMTAKYTITIKDAEGKTLTREIDGETFNVSFNYSLATYCNAMPDCELTKAMYAFGNAVRAVRNSIYK